MTTCNLCLEDKPLIKKSHIIPDFLYKSLYDEKHRIIKIDPKSFKKKGKTSSLPTGEYDSGILCLECDRDVIGQYESYASVALFGGPLPYSESPVCKNYRTPAGIEFTKCVNISYKKFKLFLLSVLWRVHISRREFFSEIDIGDSAEKIRRMILNDDPGQFNEFCVASMTYLADSSVPGDIISQPTIREIAGVRVAIFFISGMAYLFCLNDDRIPDLFDFSSIKPNNEMVTAHFPRGKAFDIILRYHGF